MSISIRSSSLDLAILFFLAISAHLFQGTNQSKVWTTTTFLDFADGTLVDGGANTYVSADGAVRLINLYDLNQDGAVDVVFPSTHDNNEAVDLFIYWGKNGYSVTRRTELSTDGGKAATVADLNAD
jgi:hypothetical protein